MRSERRSEPDAPLPYGKQWIDGLDIAAVEACLASDFLTQGPEVARFEQALVETTGARFAVAVSSGTAALHVAMLALGVGKGDVGIVPAITFVASSNAILYAGGRVRFADVDPRTALIDIASLERLVARLSGEGTPPKVIVPVDMCGQPADLAAVARIAARVGARVVEDAAHALGATYEHEGRAQRAASCAHTDAAILSFHPVKHVTTGEGGAILTNDVALAARARELRSHGIHKDPSRLVRKDEGPWYYEQTSLGFNYRLTDVQCALGTSQLRKLDEFVRRRRELAALYDAALAVEPLAGRVAPLVQHEGRASSYHLYAIRVLAPDDELAAARRKDLYVFLRERGILTQVHYIPVTWQPLYAETQETRAEDCPGANAYYAGCLSLPMFPRMSEDDVARVVSALREWATGSRA